MTLETDTELTIETMSEIATLATRISNPKVMSVQEMNVGAAKIAEEAGIVVGDIFILLQQHVKQRSAGSHPSECNEAFVNLTRFRDNKQ